MRLLIRRRALFGLGASLATAPALAGEVAGVAVSGTSRATRLTLQIAGAQRYEVSVQANPNRIVLHLPGADWRPAQAPRPGGLVRALSWADDQSRLMIELASPARPGPVRTEDGRLILTLQPASADEFAALARRGRVLASGAIRSSAHLPLVVVDPGHGGRDPGAIGASGTHEKSITLAAALELKRRLEAGGKCRVILTRGRDVFIPLAERIEIARRREAALFVSLHADSAPGARGASVYTLSETASDSLSEGLARRENQADRAGGLRLPSVPPDVQRILMSLVRQETQAGSARVARMTVQELGDTVPLLPNTHRQAAFVVLKSPDTPSMLVEMGFLSDPRDEEALKRPEYRARVAQALTRAIEAWLAQRPRAALPPGQVG